MECVMNNLETSRAEIDRIDREMAELFEKRMLACADVAAYKKEHALPIFDPERENSIIANRAKLVADHTLREYYTEYIKDVMNISKDYQSRLISGIKVVYSGCEGAFGYIAAKKLYPSSELYACSDFTDAYTAVESGKYDCALLPIENSYAGDVGVVTDLMFSGSLYVNRMVELEVVHNLIAKPGAELKKIKKVISHPQALEQCEDYIKAHGFETVAFSNTALAAKYVKEECDDTCAAIASADTAELFGLEILEDKINTSSANTTRFAVFSRAQNLPLPDSKNENEHFILLFTTKNEAGALAQALNIIGAHNYNMRTLRSRPMKDLIWSYYFFVEAEGNINTENGRNMLTELSAVCARLKLVGTYN